MKGVLKEPLRLILMIVLSLTLGSWLFPKVLDQVPSGIAVRQVLRETRNSM